MSIAQAAVWCSTSLFTRGAQSGTQARLARVKVWVAGGSCSYAKQRFWSCSVVMAAAKSLMKPVNKTRDAKMLASAKSAHKRVYVIALPSPVVRGPINRCGQPITKRQRITSCKAIKPW